VNTILYVNRTGIAWEYLRHDFPPYKTVYDNYAKWEADSSTEQIHDLLRARRDCRAYGQAGPAAPDRAGTVPVPYGRYSSQGFPP
jgi:transposase